MAPTTRSPPSASKTTTPAIAAAWSSSGSRPQPRPGADPRPLVLGQLQGRAGRYWKRKILRRFPLVGGIDVAGTVASTDPDWREGDAVLATGCGLSETRDGGYSQCVRLESRAVIAQPAGLTPREAMVLGTAGSLRRWPCCACRTTGRPGTRPAGGHWCQRRCRCAGAVHLQPCRLQRARGQRQAGPGRIPAQHRRHRGTAARRAGRHRRAAVGPLRGGLDNAGGDMLASLLAQTVPYGSVVSAGLAPVRRWT